MILRMILRMVFLNFIKVKKKSPPDFELPGRFRNLLLEIKNVYIPGTPEGIWFPPSAGSDF